MRSNYDKNLKYKYRKWMNKILKQITLLITMYCGIVVLFTR